MLFLALLGTEDLVGSERDLQEPLTHTLCFQRVPDVAVEVVVAGEHQAPAAGEGDGGDPADDALV